MIFQKGTYFFELWGAEGGDSYLNSVHYDPIGKGGYSSGFLTLSNSKTLYLFVGGRGSGGVLYSRNQALGGFNGGGIGPSDYCSSNGDRDDPPGGGGGASDIRVENDDIDTRIAVAGGGGGNGALAKSMSSNMYSYGGGIIAGSGMKTEGATDEVGNENGVGGAGACSTQSGGGGGGGYRGGFGGNSGDCGSRYIGGFTSFNGIMPQSIPGNTIFSSPYGTQERGHFGHGAIKVTLIQEKIKQQTCICHFRIPSLIFLIYPLVF